MMTTFLPVRPLPWLGMVATVLALNLGFLLFGLLAASLPPETLEERVRHAFASGELTEEDWLFQDRRRGFNQYNDCLILQMALNHDRSALREVAGPNLYLQYDNRGWHDICRTLARIAHDPEARQNLVHERYTRYWHGYVPTANILLRFFDLATLRSLLKAGVYGSLLLLLLAAAGDRRLLGYGASMAFTGFVFWGLPYFGQSLGHAPGDALAVLGPAALFFFRRRLARPEALLPFAAALGALLAYFEFLTGQLPTGAALLFAAAYLIGRTPGSGAASPLAWPTAFRAAVWAVLAFGIGAAATVMLKQLLALLVLGPDGFADFLRHLDRYAGTERTADPIGTRLRILRDLVGSGWMLTDRMTLLYGASATAWTAALGLALWRRSSALPDLLAFVLGAGIIVVWVFVLPSHTAAHIGFMNRMLVIPVGFGFAALAWQAVHLSLPGNDGAPSAPDAARGERP